MLEEIPPYVLVPRFILNLRKLHAHDLQGRRGSYIDTVFGLESAAGQSASIIFVGRGQNESQEEGEGIQMEARETRGGGTGSSAA